MQTNRHASNHPTRIRDAEQKQGIGKRADGSQADPGSRYADSSNRSGDRLIKWRPSRAPTSAPTHNNSRQPR